MPIRTFGAALIALLAGVAPASANFLVIGSNPTTELAVPFGLASDGAGDPSNRYQQVFSSSLFGPGRIAITSLTLYAQGQGAGGAFNPVTYNFSLSTTSVGVGALDPANFSANAGPDAALFASITPTGNAPPTLTINSASPFLYDPSRGNLLLDIGIVGQRLDAGFLGASFDGQADFGGLSSSADNFGGNVPTSGLSLGITYNIVVPEPPSLILGAVGGAFACLALRRKAG